MTRLPAKVFERINVKKAYSFIDIKGPHMPDVLDSFENEVYKGRRIRVDDSGGRKKSQPQKSHSFSRGKKRFYGKSSRKKYIKNPHWIHQFSGYMMSICLTGFWVCVTPMVSLILAHPFAGTVC